MGEEMYGLEYGTGYVTCSFCRQAGHNITSCSLVGTIYKNTTYEIITHDSHGDIIDRYACQPWNYVSNWWHLSHLEKKAFVEMTNREKRQAKRLKNKFKKKKSRCSYCRKEGHRKPTCKHQKKFICLLIVIELKK